MFIQKTNYVSLHPSWTKAFGTESYRGENYLIQLFLCLKVIIPSRVLVVENRYKNYPRTKHHREDKYVPREVETLK